MAQAPGGSEAYGRRLTRTGTGEVNSSQDELTRPDLLGDFYADLLHPQAAAFQVGPQATGLRFQQASQVLIAHAEGRDDATIGDADAAGEVLEDIVTE